MEVLSNPAVALFIVIFLGLALGRLHIIGINIGIAGALVAGLILGHFDLELPKVIQTIGLVLFVTSVGLMSGLDFKQVFVRFGQSFFLIALIALGMGLVLAVFVSRYMHLNAGFAAGMLAGALTSTPGLGAALEATGGDPQVSVGYAIAYPLGVLGVIGGINFIHFLVRRKGCALSLAAAAEVPPPAPTKPGGDSPEPSGDMFSFAAIILAGLLLGQVPLPFPWIGSFTLGVTGGPLLVALYFGHKGRIGPFRAIFPRPTLDFLRDFGAVLLLAEAGTSGGRHFWELVTRYGFGLFLGGLIITLITFFLACLCAFFLLKTNLPQFIGTISGVMTSTPGLITSMELLDTNEPAVTYAAIYPVALLTTCIIVKLLVSFL